MFRKHGIRQHIFDNRNCRIILSAVMLFHRYGERRQIVQRSDQRQLTGLDGSNTRLYTGLFGGIKSGQTAVPDFGGLIVAPQNIQRLTIFIRGLKISPVQLQRAAQIFFGIIPA